MKFTVYADYYDPYSKGARYRIYSNECCRLIYTHKEKVIGYPNLGEFLTKLEREGYDLSEQELDPKWEEIISYNSIKELRTTNPELFI